jgi:hypothetical protein
MSGVKTREEELFLIFYQTGGGVDLEKQNSKGLQVHVRSALGACRNRRRTTFCYLGRQQPYCQSSVLPFQCDPGIQLSVIAHPLTSVLLSEPHRTASHLPSPSVMAFHRTNMILPEANVQKDARSRQHSLHGNPVFSQPYHYRPVL